jgi:hypothetical protein
MNIFKEARQSPDGYLLVDFLSGRTWGGTPSQTLARAITLYCYALPKLCAKHGASREDFQELTAHYSAVSWQRRIVVTIQDSLGRRRVRGYMGTPARRVAVMDRFGRMRKR